jgi:N-acetylglucosamine kinase
LVINESSPATLPAGIPGLGPGRLLGIDAGGSATRVVLVTGNRVARRWTAPPMNGLLTGCFLDLLADIITPAGATAAGIGLPGVRSAPEAARLSAELTRRTGCPVHLTGDGETAWFGAFGGRPGIAVFAGTGSGATGSDGRRWVRAGGHGFLLGDEGGAYWIGRSAVSAALRWEDGTGGSAALHDAVVAMAGPGLSGLIAEIHGHPADRGLVSRFAPAVTALADGDPAARQIVTDAARHLAGLAGAIRRVLGPLPVSGLGGVFSAPVCWAAFTGLTGAVRPLAPPEVGAALLAGAPQASFARQPGNILAGVARGGDRG